MLVKNSSGFTYLLPSLLILILPNVPVVIFSAAQNIRGVQWPSPPPPTTSSTTITTTKSTTNKSDDQTTPSPTTAVSTEEVGPTIIKDDEEAANNLAINLINEYRTKHKNTPPIKFEPKLQAIAKNCARIYRLQDKFGGSKLISHKMFPDQCKEVTVENEIIFHTLEHETKNTLIFSETIQEFYNDGIKKYVNFDEPTTNLAETHQIFTQILWMDSTDVGCACDSQQHASPYYICSCIFSPAGNIRTGYSNAGLHLYTKNVMPIS